jgi:hypothetical protein
MFISKYSFWPTLRIEVTVIHDEERISDELNCFLIKAIIWSWKREIMLLIALKWGLVCAFTQMTHKSSPEVFCLHRLSDSKYPRNQISAPSRSWDRLAQLKVQQGNHRILEFSSEILWTLPKKIQNISILKIFETFPTSEKRHLLIFVLNSWSKRCRLL